MQRRTIRSLISRCVIMTMLAGTLAALGTSSSEAMALPEFGELDQRPSPDACVSATGDGGTCRDGRAIQGAEQVTTSPDGKHVYATGDSGVARFDRDTETGALTPVNTTSGCYSRNGSADGFGGQCSAIGHLPTSITSLVVSPDGSHVYLIGRDGTEDLVSLLVRDQTTGELAAPASGAPCISRTGETDDCVVDGRYYVQGGEAVFDPAGTHLYISNRNTDHILIAERAASGVVTPVAGAAGCLDESGDGVTCTDAVALDGVDGLELSADGTHFYTASGNANAIGIFDRDTTTGTLTQKAGTAGCISEDGTGGACQDGSFLTAVSSVTIAPGGTHAYVSADGATNHVALYDRDGTTGALTPRGTVASCISANGSGGQCQTGNGFTSPHKVLFADDGRTGYVEPGFGDRIEVVDRDPSTGEITQKAGTTGCISNDGDAGECEDGTALDQIGDVNVSPDGQNLYVAAEASDAVAVLDRFTCENHPFPDVPPWVDDAVDWAACLSYMTGIAGNFEPNADITRAQVARLLYRVAGSPDVSLLDPHGLTDVPPWVEEAVTWLVANDYMTGFTDDTFRPGVPISRGQVTRATFRVQGSPPGAPAHPFPDVPMWLSTAVDWVAWDQDGAGPNPPLMVGINGDFNPDDNITRAQTVRLTCRANTPPGTC